MTEPDVSDLLTVAQAIEVIDGVEVAPRVVEVALAEADGLVLAEDIVADRDYPPFDKSLMDGYAVRCADLTAKPQATLKVIGEIAAGAQAARGLAPGEAFAIMTGAPMPDGADGVVPVEDVERSTEIVRILRSTNPGRFIAKRGSDVRHGLVVLHRGSRLGPAQLTVAASVGAFRVNAFAKPRVAVLATGDELVPIDSTPGPAQIRNSNSLMLVSLLKRLGCDVTDLGVVRDTPEAVREALQNGMRFDFLFVTGGMSMGAHDYVPRTLLELGVDLKITKLRIKPGKPFVFGIRRHEGTEARRHQGGDEATGSGAADGSSLSTHSVPSRVRASVPSSTYVFGLPGNPVSGFVCTVRLAARLLARMAGAAPEPRWTNRPLLSPLPVNGPREFYQPVLLSDHGVTPLEWKGSADVYTLAAANALLVRAENEPPRAAGDVVRVLEIPS
ncbi:MAG TPA: gephyrin-like molybdotransferase Glp [Tepidisphaeraceae bacterium]|nr:gephyrin-like molybdotransferase Glp [Tepidisphaeraceae bacterium]